MKTEKHGGIGNAFIKGCLTHEEHEPLLAELDKFSAIAGLSGNYQRYIWEPLDTEKMTNEEILVLKNVKKLPEKSKAGVLYIGHSPLVIAEKFMAITGCMVRNFMDARYLPMENALNEYVKKHEIAAEVACIPNFHTAATRLPDWLLMQLYDLLLKHRSEGKLIFGYIQNPVKMKSAISSSAYAFLKANYLAIGGAL